MSRPESQMSATDLYYQTYAEPTDYSPLMDRYRAQEEQALQQMRAQNEGPTMAQGLASALISALPMLVARSVSKGPGLADAGTAGARASQLFLQDVNKRQETDKLLAREEYKTAQSRLEDLERTEAQEKRESRQARLRAGQEDARMAWEQEKEDRRDARAETRAIQAEERFNRSIALREHFFKLGQDETSRRQIRAAAAPTISFARGLDPRLIPTERAVVNKDSFKELAKVTTARSEMDQILTDSEALIKKLGAGGFSETINPDAARELGRLQSQYFIALKGQGSALTTAMSNQDREIASAGFLLPRTFEKDPKAFTQTMKGLLDDIQRRRAVLDKYSSITADKYGFLWTPERLGADELQGRTAFLVNLIEGDYGMASDMGSRVVGGAAGTEQGQVNSSGRTPEEEKEYQQLLKLKGK